MCKIICLTNRKLCKDNFFERISEITKYVDKIILREKDLQIEEYISLAEKVYEICGDKLIIHNFPLAAQRLKINRLHLPLGVLKKLSLSEISKYEEIGTSCHSLEDAKIAKEFGCTYCFAGHIFETDCKKGLKGRGLDFLNNITKNIDIPVYAIGGIKSENIKSVIKAGADGACIMSGLMTCDNIKNYIDTMKGALNEI